jgi:hypothetical protein
MPIVAMKKSARISPCRQYRWTLTRDWGQGKRICWVMLNPSDADHRIDDPTIRRVIHFTRSWGYTGLTVVNLYPYRSPNPKRCEAWATDPKLATAVKVALTRNVSIISHHCKLATMIVAAWGNNPWDVVWLESIVDSIGQEIYCLGTTAGGAPKHPMARGKHRIADDQQPVLWRKT